MDFAAFFAIFSVYLFRQTKHRSLHNKQIPVFLTYQAKG